MEEIDKSKEKAGNAPPQTLPLAPKHVTLHRLVLLRREPPYPLPVLAPYALAPRQPIIHLDEVVVPQHGAPRLHPPEEVGHGLLELVLEPGHVPAGVYLAEAHPELVLEAPEAGEQDGAREEVVLPVGAFEHDGEVVLDEARGELHRVFGEGPREDVEGLARGEVVHAHGRLLEERGVALREVGAEFLEEFVGGVEGFRGRAAAFGAPRGDARGFEGVVFQVLVVELDPFGPVHVAETEGDVVLWAVAEGTVGEGRRGGEGPVWVRGCGGSLEVHRGPD